MQLPTPYSFIKIKLKLFISKPHKTKIFSLLLGSHGIDGGFVSSTCWIQGVYIYKELRARVDEVAYFGIPKDIDLDGILNDTPNKELCPLTPKLSEKRKEGCTPMEKTFFIQVCTFSNNVCNEFYCLHTPSGDSDYRFFI